MPNVNARMSSEAAGTAAEVLSERIGIYDQAIAQMKGEKTERDAFDFTGEDAVDSLIEDADDVQQLERIRAQLVEAQEALNTAIECAIN